MVLGAAVSTIADGISVAVPDTASVAGFEGVAAVVGVVTFKVLISAF